MSKATQEHFEEFQDYYRDRKMLVDDRIDEILVDNEEFATKRRLLAHATEGGKRIRPVLTLLVAERYDAPLAQALNHAAIVELIHNASLVADDRVDGDEERRGKPTVWRLIDKLPLGSTGNKVTTAATVMSQNGLLALALELAEDPDVVYAMGEGVRSLVDGFFMEGRDVFSGMLGGGYKRYIEVNKAKTGGLFALAAWMPATYTDASEEEVNAARKYGENTGILYQVADDWADGDLPSYIDDPNEELEKWYDEAIGYIEGMPAGGSERFLRVAPGWMVYKMLEQEGMLADADVHFIPDALTGEAPAE